MAIALELLTELQPGHLVTHVFELEEVADALHDRGGRPDGRRGQGRVRAATAA
jgi:hypothetical protein